MPLLLGEPPKTRDFVPIDRTEIYFDDNRENYALHLVGVRKYFKKPYAYGLKKLGISTKGYSDLEFAIAISPVPNIISNPVELVYFMEINPFGTSVRTYDNAHIEWKRADLHYGIVRPKKSEKSEIPKKVIVIDKEYILPSTNDKPFSSNVISRKTFREWAGKLKEEDPKKNFQISKEFYDYIANLFTCEDMHSYKKINQRQIPTPHNEYPVFSLYNFGRINLEDELIDWGSMPEKAINFIFGTDRHIKDEVPSIDQWRLHFVETLLAVAGIGGSIPWFLDNLRDNESLRYAGPITGLIYFGLVDGAYRMYKNLTNHIAPRSGIIGALTEKITHNIPFF